MFRQAGVVLVLACFGAAIAVGLAIAIVETIVWAMTR